MKISDGIFWPSDQTWSLTYTCVWYSNHANKSSENGRKHTRCHSFRGRDDRKQSFRWRENKREVKNQAICIHVKAKQTLSWRPGNTGVRGQIAVSRGSHFTPLKSGDLRKAVCARGRWQQLSTGAVFLTGDIEKEKQLWRAHGRRASNCSERRNNGASVTVIRTCYCYRFRRAFQIKRPN